MSSKSKKSNTSTKGTAKKRYSAAEKKAVVDFVADYDAKNGRGGKSAAAKKFKVSPLTVASWIKAPAKKSAKKVSAAKKSPKSIGVGKRGARYTTEQKAEVVDFVNDYNARNGRGGQSQAAKQFGLSVLTVASWLRSPHVGGSKSISPKSGTVPAGLNAKFASLIEVSDELRKMEAEVSRLRAKYDALRSSIQGML